MLKGQAGQILINSILPEDLRDYNRLLDKKGVSKLLSEIGTKYPDRYGDIVHDIMRAGHQTAYWTGGMSFDLNHMSTPKEVKALKAQLAKDVETIWANKRLTDKQKEELVLKKASDYQEKISESVYAEAEKTDNPLALQVLSGARGNKSNLSSLRGADVLYMDHHKNPIPVPVVKSYAEGLDPHEYFAGTFGARSGLAETKLSVADTGFLCLMEGTLVAMADGGEKAIEDIQIGDKVLGADNQGKVFPVTVTNKFDNGERVCHRFLFRKVTSSCCHADIEILATANHRVLAKGYYSNKTNVVTSLMEISRDSMYIVLEDETCAFLVSDVLLGDKQTWDIEVDHPDHLFVLANGAIVSNSKQFVQATHRLLVTHMDGRGPHDNLVRGLPTDIEDPYNEGALLANDYKGYKRNTVLTPKILSALKSKGVKELLVRSPLVGGPVSGGVYGYDVGVREKGRIAPVGDFVGIAAGQALSEGITQGTLGAKHGGGVAGTSKVSGGFKTINQLVQVPKVFQSGATHAQVDGKVQGIEEAPQGGKYVFIDGHKHYVHQGFEPTVKPGQEIEAGDMLSEGLPNPAEVVKFKGIGEGRKYFVDTMMDIYKKSGISAHRRNLELIARGLINHVRLTQEHDDYVPDDVRPYSYVEYHYQPRDGHKIVDPRQAKGMYLERPYLHYSIGTQVRPSVIKRLQNFNIKDIAVHHEPPPFESEMVRGLEVVANDPDWMTRFLGSYVKKNLLRGVHRAHMSDERGTSYVPSLARAVDFNKFPPVVGYEPDKPAVMKAPVRKSLLEGLGDGGLNQGVDAPAVQASSQLK